MSKMKFDNARHPEQLRRMKVLAKKGACHFCGKNFTETHSAPVIFKNKNWFVTANDFPYQGSVHHYLIVSKNHITKISKINQSAKIELFDAISWLEKKLKAKGESIFVRSGDMSYTAATIDHLHFHFIIGKKKNNKKPNELRELIIAPVGYKNK